MKSSAVHVGDLAPAIDLPDAWGRPTGGISASSHPLLVVFYRGHWCTICRRQLTRLVEAFAPIADLGASVVAVSAEDAAAVRAATAGDMPPFPLVPDARLHIIDRYGVRDVDPERGPIARPAIFVADRVGVVRFAHVAAHPRDRPALGAILLALESLQ